MNLKNKYGKIFLYSIILLYIETIIKSLLKNINIDVANYSGLFKSSIIIILIYFNQNKEISLLCTNFKINFNKKDIKFD